jgi:hypothetical protein
MTYGGAAAASGAAAAAAIAAATKASGAIVRMHPEEFKKILNKRIDPVVVVAVGGVFKKKHLYLTNYKGLFFYTESPEVLTLPNKAEVILAKKIWVP